MSSIWRCAPSRAPERARSSFAKPASRRTTSPSPPGTCAAGPWEGASDMTAVADLPVTPIRPEDAAGLIDLFYRSSEKTRRERFHGSLRDFPPCYLDDIVHGTHAVVTRVVRDLASDANGGCI